MLEGQTQKQSDELSAMNQKFNELTAVKAAGDKEIEGLKKTIAEWEAVCKKNVSEIAASNKRIAELEALLANREATAKKDASTIAALERQFLVHIIPYLQPSFLQPLSPMSSRCINPFILSPISCLHFNPNLLFYIVPFNPGAFANAGSFCW